MKIAIIGGGFCGLAAAWYLLQETVCFPNLEIHLFDNKKIGQGTSGSATGLLHPFAGAHAKLNWRGREGFQATKELLTIASEALQKPITANDQGILRLAINETQMADFKKCHMLYPNETQWLDPSHCQQLSSHAVQAPGLWIKTGLTVYARPYLQGLWLACQKKGAIKWIQKTIHHLDELKDFNFKIVTAGAETKQLPELSSLPLKQVKGQTLELAWPKGIPRLKCALNSHLYMVMTEARTSCLIGATFEKEFETTNINLKVATEELLPRATLLFPPLHNASLLNCYAGLRAVGPQHRPLLQQISSTEWVLTGMGSKGLLYHALFAKELVENLLRYANMNFASV